MSDNGLSPDAAANADFFIVTRIERLDIAPYHPKSNAIAESFSSTHERAGYTR